MAQPDTVSQARRRRRFLALLAISMLVFWWVVVMVSEFNSSHFQAHYFSNLARESRFELDPGPSPSIVFPGEGPYDRRLGYSDLPVFVDRLTGRGFVVQSQARFSRRLVALSELGISPAYHEKSQAGLEVLDRNQEPIFNYRYPERVYRDFGAVPNLVLESLLFIENRELFDARHPKRNPAIEWDRLGKAVLDQALHALHLSSDAPGGSTLATQIEKYRHSPEGRTSTIKEKFRQMASASVRAYLDGEVVSQARRRIVLDYLNSVPLAAKPGYGEVSGLGDGLWAWFGRDFGETNRLLQDDRDSSHGLLAARAQAYKEVLSLMISQRRPSYYLVGRRDELAAATDSHLRLLAAAGVITPAFRDAALKAKLAWRREDPASQPVSFVTRKAATAIRADLAELLGVPRIYDLDRLDLTASTTLDSPSQIAVTRMLRSLADPGKVAADGLRGEHLLEESDPAKVIYSFTLYERTGDANVLRVQTDNLNQPFDLNRGAKLDLGSTAKLRTVIHYLEIVADLHRHYHGMSRKQLQAVAVNPKDAIGRWAVDYFLTARDTSLPAMLDAALDRSYSASPAEVFFTGGGVQTFHNFDEEDDHRVMPVRQGFRNSVNLVFVRLMRDIVRHHVYGGAPTASARLPDDVSEADRQAYLEQFADREGRTFLQGFYRKYQGKSPEEAELMLLKGAHSSPRAVAAVFLSLDPSARRQAFDSFVRAHLPDRVLSDDTLSRLYQQVSPSRMSLADRGYVSGVHPLELWMVGFLRHHPDAGITQVMEASIQERQEVYRWLFNTSHRQAQNKRIQNMREVEAFRQIARAWKRLGYPFDSLVPSYGTALGTSADRPAALADLMGILVNNGMRLPTVEIDKLHFAAGTPYETVLEPKFEPGEQVLAPEIAAAVRGLLVDVVEEGTARRARDAFATSDGTPMPVGGKTGTGDHRYDVFGPHGELIESRVVNRSAVFVFNIGERFFGTITAYVPGPQAADYGFTSALPVQLLKMLAPALQPLIDSPQTAAPRGPNRLAAAEPPAPETPPPPGAKATAADDPSPGQGDPPPAPDPDPAPPPDGGTEQAAAHGGKIVLYPNL
jgi:membrane peptidoglycan carboxypeptidase